MRHKINGHCWKVVVVENGGCYSQVVSISRCLLISSGFSIFFWHVPYSSEIEVFKGLLLIFSSIKRAHFPITLLKGRRCRNASFFTPNNKSKLMPMSLEYIPLRTCSQRGGRWLTRPRRRSCTSLPRPRPKNYALSSDNRNIFLRIFFESQSWLEFLISNKCL